MDTEWLPPFEIVQLLLSQKRLKFIGVFFFISALCSLYKLVGV